jgi:hypothetical protein
MSSAGGDSDEDGGGDAEGTSDGNPWNAIEQESGYGNPKSTRVYGHSRSRHGSQRDSQQLIDRARGKNTPQGQWHDNNDIVRAEQVSRQAGWELYDSTGENAIIIDMGRTIGDVYLPDGTTIQTRWAIIVRRPNGHVKTTYPTIP